MGSEGSAVDLDSDSSWSLSRFIAATRRHWPLLAAALVVSLLLGGIASLLQPRSYSSEVRVAVEPAGQRDALERVLFGTSDLGTQKQILTSTPLVREVLKAAGLPSDASFARAFVSNRVTTEVLIDAAVLQITVEDDDPQRAAQLAQGLAEQYLAYLDRDAGARVEEVQADLAAEERAARLRLRSLDQQLAADPAGAARTSLEDERDDLFASIRFIVARRVELDTAEALARRGTIIEPASVNTRPTSPNVPLNLLLAAALGLTLGCILVALRARSDDRLHDLDALRDEVPGTPLLVVPRASAVDAGRLGAGVAGADDVFQRLQAILSSASASDRPRSAAVCSADHEDSARGVAVGLARAVAEGGDRVVLVDGSVRHGAGSLLLGVDGPGMAELMLDKDARAADLLQRVQGVAVLPAGQTSEQARPRLRTPRLQALIQALHGEADDVVLAAPPVQAAAEALEIARAAAQAVLVVVLGRTTRTELVDSLRQLAEAGARLRAVVCLTR